MKTGVPTIDRSWKPFALTTLFCIAIAITLWILGGTGDLTDNLIVSFAIGWSIVAAYAVFEDFFGKFMSPYIAPIPITAIGLTTGLLIGGTLLIGDPLL